MIMYMYLYLHIEIYTYIYILMYTYVYQILYIVNLFYFSSTDSFLSNLHKRDLLGNIKLKMIPIAIENQNRGRGL